MQHPMTRRLVAALVASLQVIPAGLLPQLAQAQTVPAVQPAQYEYDAQGNLTKVTDPNGKTTIQVPDYLDRTQTVKPPIPKAGAAQPVVSYTYDGLNRLVSVTDARNVKTSYFYFGLNDVSQVSKDSGTLTSWVNENGDAYYNTNSRSLSRYSGSNYDGLGRPLSVTYLDEGGTGIKGTTRFGYDAKSTTPGAENYGAGHLTSVTNYKGTGTSNVADSVSLRYDQLGRVTWRCQFWGGGVSAGSASACTDGDALRYSWADNSSPTDAGRLMGLIYPSGRQVSYQYDDQGRISAISTTDPASTTTRGVISNVQYTPLAVAERGYALSGWTFGNGSGTPNQTYSRQYDALGRLTNFTLGAGAVGLKTAQTLYSLTLDDAGRVSEIDTLTAQSSPLSNVYGYDDLNRLTSASLPGGLSYSYDYELNGNRTLKTSGSVTTNYTYATGTKLSNRLSTVQVGTDAAQNVATDLTGNITADPVAAVGAVTYTYDDRANVPFGRLSRSQGPGAQWDYLHNYFGQRIRKTGSSYTPTGGSLLTPQAYVGSTDTLFYYDLQGHLIAEVDGSGGATVSPKPVKREYIWLGDTLVAIIAGSTPDAVIGTNNAPAVYYVHTDHLDTPRMVTDTAGNRRWTWDLMASEPFGASAANEAPAGQSGAQVMAFNLRFPGQYLDKETGSFYNYYRTYNPSTGRYLQSDPIGLAGGLNTYAYVGGNPLSYADPTGEMKLPGDPSGLPSDWQRDPSHRDPNGEKWVHPGGDTLDWHKGRPGMPGWRGKDHWHHNGGDDHLPPGTEVPDPVMPPAPREMCGDNCKRVLKSVRDAVTGAIIFTFVLVCSTS